MSTQTARGCQSVSALRIRGLAKENQGQLLDQCRESQALVDKGFQLRCSSSFLHFPQGMSLDCVEISLGRVFASGQAYVALSRARSLQGLRVLDFDPTVVRCDPRVLSFYAALGRGRGLSLVRGSLLMVGHVAWEAWELGRRDGQGTVG